MIALQNDHRGRVRLCQDGGDHRSPAGGLRKATAPDSLAGNPPGCPDSGCHRA